MIDYTHYSYNNWIKSKSNLGQTLENSITNIENNPIILKLQKWKNVISNILKYFDKKNHEEIQNKLKLNKKEQKDMQVEILQHIFLYSIKKKLLNKNY